MKNFKDARLALLAIALFMTQGCQQSPQVSSNNPGVNTSNSGAASQQQSSPQTQLKVGEMAPDFTLTDTNGQPVKLSDFRGKKNVALAFYVLAFTGG